MARLSVGLEEFEKLETQLEAVETGMKGEALRRILEAGARPVVEAWKDSIRAHGHVLSGRMHDAVAATQVRFGTDGASLSVYPQGDDQGISNAKKAYIIHHGYLGHRTKHTGDRFVTKAEKASEELALFAMQDELNKITGGQ